MTLIAGAAALSDLPQPQPAPAATAVGTSTLEQASLSSLSQPVSDVIAEQNAATDNLQKEAEEDRRDPEVSGTP